MVASHDKDFLEQVVDKYLFYDGNGNYKISLDWKAFQMKPSKDNPLNKIEKKKF